MMRTCDDHFHTPFKGFHVFAPGPEQAILSGLLRHLNAIRHVSPILVNRTGQIDLLSGRLYPLDDPYGIKAWR